MTVGLGSFDDVLPSRAARLAAERARCLYAGVGILIGSTLAVTALLGIPAALANAASDGASVAFDQAPVADGDLGAGRSPIDDAIPTAPLDGDPTTQDQAIPGQDPFSTAPVPPSPRRVPAEEPDRGGRGSTMQFSFLLTHRPFDEDGDDDEPGLTAGPRATRGRTAATRRPASSPWSRPPTPGTGSMRGRPWTTARPATPSRRARSQPSPRGRPATPSPRARCPRSRSSRAATPSRRTASSPRRTCGPRGPGPTRSGYRG